jgi:hypothetical protein
MTLPRFVPLVVLLPLFITTVTGGQNRTLQSFGVRVERGQPVYPLPSHVALGLYDPDLWPDLAYYYESKVQIWRNMGNGTFGSEPIYERSIAGQVRELYWKKSNMFNAMIYDHTSWGNLYVTYSNGQEEMISHQQIQQAATRFASLPSMNTPFPSIGFHEVWRSRHQEQPIPTVLVDDVDNDGKTELVYFIKTLRSQGDTNLIVIYEHVANNTYVVDWDTLLHNGGYPYAITDVDRNGKKEIVIISTVNAGMALLECSGPRQYRMYESNIGFSSPGMITRVVQTDVDHDGRRELCVVHSNPQPPPGVEATRIYVDEFSSRGADGSFGFNGEIARYYGFIFDLAVGQMDGTGIEELVPAGGSFGVNEPVPVEYLWGSPTAGWRVRGVYTGLQSGTAAVRFVNTDADSAMEFFSGAPGPIGHGSAFLLDYVSDTTWRVVFADSSLRNSPRWVDSGMLDGQFVVAASNTWDRSQLDTTYSDFNAYLPQGQKLGTWRLDSAYIDSFSLLDIDSDHRTDLIFAWASFLPAIMFRHHAANYESDFATGVGESLDAPLMVRLEQNYPNPFNATTNISFSVPSGRELVPTGQVPNSNFVSLKVFDVLGQEVATLLQEEKPAGRYSVQWHATNLASGVYLYTLQTSTHKLTRKMLLVK